VTVPDGRLWVMGDHRSASADSKAHVGDQYSGTIGVDDVIGKAALIVWPVSRFGLLESPDIQGAAAGAGVPAPSAPAAPALVMPYAIGLLGAAPISAWRLRRRSRRR
jgi:signal peptidase I